MVIILLNFVQSVILIQNNFEISYRYATCELDQKIIRINLLEIIQRPALTPDQSRFELYHWCVAKARN